MKRYSDKLTQLSPDSGQGDSPIFADTKIGTVPGFAGRTTLSVLVLLAAALAASPLSAAPAARGHSWALLIGIEKYLFVPGLHYTVNDVQELAKTLHERANFDTEQMYDDVEPARLRPLKASIEKELAEWLQQPEAEDTVLVYFSGHGFRDPAGKMYLAPIDCNPSDLTHTAIPIEWVRQQIAGCKAKFKLLILDSCHAGSEKGEADRMAVGGNDLGEPFKDLEGVVTLASSTAKQQSQIWEDKQQSLFSYWLNLGLRGHADEDGDGKVDVDELYKYVYANVKRTAERHMPLKQTPVRIVRPGTEGVPVVARLAPMTLRQVLSDTAQQLADAIADRKLGKVGVLEFTNDTKLGELLGADFGSLGRYCSAELERRLSDEANGKFSVMDSKRLQNVLQAQGFKIGDLGNSVALKDLSTASGGMPTIAVGTLRNRMGRVVNIQCRLVSTGSDDVFGAGGGTAVLNESEWAMLGGSVVVKPEYRRQATPPPGQPGKSAEEQLIRRLDFQVAKNGHPLAEADCPFPVKMMINGEERKGVFRGNDYFVPVRKGEVYEIHVENRTKDLVLMRLLVDGLNTLPQKLDTKGVRMEVVAPRVNLDEARGWQLAAGTTNVVRGFVTTTGAEGELRQFKIADAAESQAARQNFTDQIGIITAAFFSVVEPTSAPTTRSVKPGTVGTVLGEKAKENLEEGKKRLKTGPLLAAITIHYVDADAMPSGDPQQ